MTMTEEEIKAHRERSKLLNKKTIIIAKELDGLSVAEAISVLDNAKNMICNASSVNCSSLAFQKTSEEMTCPKKYYWFLYIIIAVYLSELPLFGFES